MRLAAETLLGGKPGFISVNGDGERTTLPDESFNAITAAQAFHWFPTPAAVTEFGRILRPKGRTFLIWNDRKTECDTFHQEYENLLLRYGTDYALVNHRNITEEILRGLFSGWSCESFRIENHQDLTLDALLGRLDSSSYCPPPGHPNHAPLMAAAESLFHREAGKGLVRMRYECVVYHLKRIR
jgi:SAM-dependent methyltransferase